MSNLAIKDENGNVQLDLAGLDLAEVQKAIDKLKGVNKRSPSRKYTDLKNIKFSADNKFIEFHFSDNLLRYNFIERTFTHGRFGEEYDPAVDHHLKESHFSKISWPKKNHTRDFFRSLAAKADCTKAEMFFNLLHQYSYRNTDTAEERNRNVIKTLINPDNKNLIDAIESVVKCNKLEGFTVADLWTSIYWNDSKQYLTASDILKKSYSNWYLDNINQDTDESYYQEFTNAHSNWLNRDFFDVTDSTKLSEFHILYAQYKEQGLEHAFQYCWEKYKKPLPSGVGNFREMVEFFGYNYKRLIDYIVVDMSQQGLIYNHRNERDVFNEIFDYAHMNHDMEVDYQKYPKYLKVAHDITTINYNMFNSKKISANFDSVRTEIHPLLKFEPNGYLFIPADSARSLIKEGCALNHCVGSYAKRVGQGETNIVFLRKQEKPNESYITIEVSNGLEIVQAKGANNRNLTEIERTLLKIYKDHLRRMKRTKAGETATSNS